MAQHSSGAKGWSDARIEEIAPGERQAPIRRHFGIEGFGVNAWRGLEVGDTIIGGHDEVVTGELHEELYFVAAGRASFTLDGEPLDAPQGTLLFVRPETWRAAAAAEPGTVVLAVGAPAGRPFTPSAWEQWAVLGIQELYDAGRYAEAAERYRGLLEDYADHPGVHFNLSCLLSLADRPEEALGQLARSVEIDPRNKEFAREDRDFDPIRNDPRFDEITGPGGES